MKIKKKCYSEMWEARRWNDSHMYHAPMVMLCNGERVFAGDFIEYSTEDDGQKIEGIAKVKKFYVNEEVMFLF